MSAKLNSMGEVLPCTLQEAAVQVKIASDLLHCVNMAVESIDDDLQRRGLSRTSNLVADHLVRALDIIEGLMREERQ